MESPPLQAAVSGSMRRHLAEMRSAAAALTDAGVQVLSPRSFRAVGEEEGFVFTEGDAGPPTAIQARHLAAIAQADFLLVVCPAGYVGPSATFEVGYAVALGVPVFATEAPRERVVAERVTVVSDLSSLAVGP